MRTYVPFMHGPELRQEALQLIADGLNDGAVGRGLGLPRTTVRDWRRLGDRPEPDRCPRCWRPMRPLRADSADYAELLGVYLGDGCISLAGRVERLRVSLDARHPFVVDDIEALLRRCLPDNRVGRVHAHGGSNVILSTYHGHLSCLFPQHGSGRKHERPIVLEPWQSEHVSAAPWSFLRGCIRTDGCVFVNRTGRYEYLSYEFRNYSQDILGIFVATCDLVGLRPRRYAKRVRLCRRADVALLLEHVGTKGRAESIR
jgi:hypothetical protein